MKRLTGNQLKIIALLSMTCDHIGRQILPRHMILKIIGRLAFPIFAYMIAEGCRYTKNRKKYLSVIVWMAFGCQLVYYMAMQSLYQCVLVTFSLAIAMIYLMDYAMKEKTWFAWLSVSACFLGIYMVCEILPEILTGTDFAIDYGFWGVMLSVFVYLGKTKKMKLLLMSGGLAVLAFEMGQIQWYSLGAVLLLAMYGGRRGTMNLKYLFYVYYPLHLAVIYVVSLVL